MVHAKCDMCGKIFNRPPSSLKRARYKYCSMGCRDVHRVIESERKKIYLFNKFTDYITKHQPVSTTTMFKALGLNKRAAAYFREYRDEVKCIKPKGKKWIMKTSIELNVSRKEAINNE